MRIIKKAKFLLPVLVMLLALGISVKTPVASAAAARCASESSNGDRVLESDCSGYYTGKSDNPQPYSFQPDHCYEITRPESGPNDFDIKELPSCENFESLLRVAPDNSTPGSVKNDCNVAIKDIDNSDSRTDNDCGIVKYIQIFTNILSGLVGIIIVAMIIVGGIQYTTSGDNPTSLSNARKRIMNALLALVVYFFMFAFLQWLVPGGIF
ncbi:MAG TPA: pilin [Patescibacteria group bacterium]|nr:pilin [Patescibacteria group bacterium]